MTAKAEYIPNGYVCNKCGSRMDAIITPPLSTLGKIKLVCNNCNKYMTKNWQERFDEMSEINEFYGLPYNDLVDSSIKQFISDIITQTREETIRDVEAEMVNINQAYEGEALDTNNNRRWYEQGFGEYKEEIKKMLNKLKK